MSERDELGLLTELKRLAEEGYDFYRPFESDPEMGYFISLKRWITEFEETIKE